jgi:dihydroflavonol-4-reductase
VAILVTGGTGLLGNNVIRLLLDRGEQVRALVRDGADERPFRGLDVDRRSGDVRDPDAVRRAVAGVSCVVHCAGLVHIGWTRLAEARAINVDGSLHVADAARAAGARMVHVSTIDVLAPGRRDQPADEETPGEKVPCTYVVTKRAAEQAVRQRAADGLDAVIVNPALMLGPWDWKPSSGRMMLEIARLWAPFSPRGGVSICDARDVAAGILAAIERGQAGRRYILAGHNVTYQHAWRRFAALGGRRGPLCSGGPLGRWLVGTFGDVKARLTGRETDVNSAGLRMAYLYHYYTSARAESELGYRNRPLEDTIRDAWEWFMEWGYVRR